MLAGLAPVFNQLDTKFLAPAQAAGNDSYVVSLLHFDCPPAFVGGTYVRDSAYGAPSRAALWSVRAGAPICDHSVNGKFGQYMFFGGTASIQCPHAADLCPTGDYTIDGWCFPTGVRTGGIYGKVLDGTLVGGFLIIQTAANRFAFYASSNGTAWDIVSGGDMGAYSINNWYHLAVCRKGNNYYLFNNGALVTTFSSALTPLQSSCVLTVGAQGPSNPAAGALDEWRFSNGIARWTAAFTPQNEPYKSRLTGNDEATKLLLHFDNNLTDVAKGSLVAPHVFTNVGTIFAGSAGNTALKTNVLQTNGAATRITCPNAIDFDFQNANWAIDFWYYRIAAGGANVHVASKRASNGAIAPWLIMDNTNVLTFLGSFSGSAWDVNFGFGAVSLQAWTHIAVQRSGPWIFGSINGVQGGAANIGTTKLWLNNDLTAIAGNDAVSMSCYIEEFRISDICRWPVSPFTPLAVPYS